MSLTIKKCEYITNRYLIGSVDNYKTRMTTFISSEALLNYIKDIWNIISEIKKKNHATFLQIKFFFYISAFCSLTDRQNI